jgi:hypothetical protein
VFAREYLKRELERLDGLLSDRVNIYIIGGGAMSFQNLKDATKDIDVIVRSGNEMEQLGDALTRTGYFVPAIRGPYKKMQASLIMENQDGFRWDIFVNVVCGGLSLSSSMKERALTLFSMDRLSVHMLSLEDIFVFKSVTSRKRDKEDMYLLFLQGLDFDIIRIEIIKQNEQNRNAAWIAFFFNGLEEMVERYSVVIPYFEDFHDMGYSDMLSQMIMDRLKKESATEEEIVHEFGVDDIDKHIESLVKKKLVVRNSDGSYSLNLIL